MLDLLPHRPADSYGEGHFGASRGSRTHTGQDFACYPGTKITAPVDGIVTKLGYPYADDLSYRYVEVTDSDGLRHRLFYVEPGVSVDDAVLEGVTILGCAQDICARYPNGMTGHVHYEIKTTGGSFINPLDFLECGR